MIEWMMSPPLDMGETWGTFDIRKVRTSVDGKTGGIDFRHFKSFREVLYSSWDEKLNHPTSFIRNYICPSHGLPSWLSISGNAVETLASVNMLRITEYH